jgi:hypothetical protein
LLPLSTSESPNTKKALGLDSAFAWTMTPTTKNIQKEIIMKGTKLEGIVICIVLVEKN